MNVATGLAAAAAWCAVYLAWTALFFKVIDPLLRAALGGLVWRYDARQFFERGRYRRWHWAPPAVDPATVSWREFVVDLEGVVVVNVVAGALPVGTLFIRTLVPPLTMYLSLFAFIAVYGVFWSGRYRALRR